MRTLHINGLTPPALAVAIALSEKGLEYEVAAHDWRETPQALGQCGDSLELTHNLEGEFPILVNGDDMVCDSYFILEYLDDHYPEPRLKPLDPYGQWQVQAFARFLGERALPAVSTLGVAQKFASAAADEPAIAAFQSAPVLTAERRAAWADIARQTGDEALLAESLRKVDLLFERVEKALGDGGGPWLLGAQYTLSDIAAFALVQPFLSATIVTDGTTAGTLTHSWFDRLSARPAVIAAFGAGDPAWLPGPEHARWG